MEIAIGIICGGLISWFITHTYYKKSMLEQSRESQAGTKALLTVIGTLENNTHDVLLARVLDESIDEYRRAGTPVRVLDSYDNLTKEEKADLYDKVMMRVKGRLGKSNKYR